MSRSLIQRLVRPGLPAACAMALALLGTTTPAAVAANAVATLSVTIVSPTGTEPPVAVSVSTLDNNVDVQNQSTTFGALSINLRGILGAYYGTSAVDGSTFTIGGTSIVELAKLLGVPAAAITGVSVQDGNARAIDPTAPGPLETLTGAEVVNGFADPDPTDHDPKYAVFSDFDALAGAGGVALLRPKGDGDLSESLLVPVVIDRSTTPATSTVTVNVVVTVSAPPLQVGPVSASSTTPPINDAVAFSPPTVKYNGAPDTSSGLTYSWNFGDGGPGSSAANPTRAFPVAGTWPVTVTVTDPQTGASGVSVPAVVINARQTRTGGTPPPNPQGGGPPGPTTGNAPSGTNGTLGTTKVLTGGGSQKTGLSSGKTKPSVHTQSATPPPGSVAPSSKTLGTSTGSGGSGGQNGGSGSARGAAGSRGSASGVSGGSGQRAKGAAAANKTATSNEAVAPPLQLVGFLVSSSSTQSPLSVLAAATSSHQLASARASQGSGQDHTSSLTWLLGLAALAAVIAWGGMRELDARADYRRLARS
jgi:PKD domain-containing protein